jgi:hypothetical protein
MILKKNIKFLSKKESVLIFILLAPIAILLSGPLLIIFIIKGLFRIILRNNSQNFANRNQPYF